MIYLYYIRYFIYIAWNWSLRLAAFCIYHEVRGEKKYGIDTARLNNLQQLTVRGAHLNDAEIYQGANYYILEKVLEYLDTLRIATVFVDIGCGKGRAMVVAAQYHFTDITGIDFAAELCRDAEANCQQITKKYPDTKWRVVNADATDYQFADDTEVFFFFNPFKAAVMTRVIQNIEASLLRKPRKIHIAYINPQHKMLFAESGYSELIHIKRECALLKRAFTKKARRLYADGP